MKDQEQSFWRTLPGIVTAVGTLVGALAALLTALYTAEIIGSKGKSGEPTAMTEPAAHDRSVPE